MKQDMMDVSQHIQETADRVRRAASEQVNFSDLARRVHHDDSAGMNFWAGDESAAQAAIPVVLSAPRPEDIDAAIAAVESPDHGGALLRPALATLALGIARRPDAAAPVVSLVAAPELSPKERIVAIDTAQQMMFNPQAFANYRADYLKALRGLVEDRNLQVRRRALTTLCGLKDEYAQRVLASGLRGERKSLLPAAEAISLIGGDVHADHYPLLRQLAGIAPTRSARLAAIHALAGDPAAAGLLSGFIADRTEYVDVRKASARVLRAIAPEEADRLTRSIVLSDDEDDRLRAASLSILAHAGSAAEGLSPDGALERKASELRVSTRSRALKRASAAYLDKRGTTK